MENKLNLAAIVLLISVALATCVPTSVLIKDSKLSNNFKVKRSSNEKVPSDLPSSSQSVEESQNKQTAQLHTSTKDDHIIPFNKNDKQPQILQKRGINSQLPYDDLYNPLIQSAIQSDPAPNGIWGNEIDPPLLYSDLHEFEEYPRGPYRNKPYDNLQNILNADAYSERMPLPLHYPIRYLGDRKKRSNKFLKKYDTPLKRETQLTPADMLALVALVEAGERSRQDTETDDMNNNNDYMKPYYPGFEYPNNQNNDENDYGNAWLEPSLVDYYGMPYNLETIPKYEVVRDHKIGAANRYPSSKRFMVSKKKRSLGHFLDEPVAVSGNSFMPPQRFNKGNNKQPLF